MKSNSNDKTLQSIEKKSEQKCEHKYRHIGKVKSAHGLKGDIYILIFSKDSSWFEKVKHIRLTQNAQPFVSMASAVSYRIIDFRKSKEGVIVKLEGIDSRNLSDQLVGSNVWVDQDVFVSASAAEKPYLVEIEEFKVCDADLGVLGHIKGFSSNGAQDLLIVQSLERKNSKDQENSKDQTTYEIPFVDAFVEKIDYEAKTLFVCLPLGLLEINDSE